MACRKDETCYTKKIPEKDSEVSAMEGVWDFSKEKKNQKAKKQKSKKAKAKAKKKKKFETTQEGVQNKARPLHGFCVKKRNQGPENLTKRINGKLVSRSYLIGPINPFDLLHVSQKPSANYDWRVALRHSFFPFLHSVLPLSSPQ